MKGALVAPFVFCALGLAAVGSIVASPMLWASSILVLVCPVGREQEPRPVITPIALAVCGYIAWVLTNDFVNSPYTAAGIFHPAFLAAGFVFSRRLTASAREKAIGALLVGMTLLASWALWQAASGHGRADAHFETPNTFASVLNLALAPVLFRIAYGDDRRSVIGLALLLTAALVATLSRGGFIALAGGVLAAGLLFAARPPGSGVARAFAVLGLGGGAGALALQLPHWLTARALPPAAQLEGLASTLGGTLGSRSELYRLAFSALGERLWLGSGYLGFNALFEAGRAQVPSYAAENITYFVHSDYLQTVLELGVPGLLALIAIVVTPFWLARRSAPGADRLSLYAALAGLATMAIHALGDFPFYVPICLLLFGALLGEADRLLARERFPTSRISLPIRAASTGGLALFALLIAPPPLAEAAAAYGERSWRIGEAQSAAFGFELARRFQPRDWRYHWYAGQFWYAQATLRADANAAQRADEAFAAAVKANPADPRPILGRIAAQLRFSRMLERPQSAATLRDWAEHALALRPLDAAVRRDYAAALAQLRDRP